MSQAGSASERQIADGTRRRPADPGLLAEVVRIGRSLTAAPGEPHILSTRRDVLVVRVGDVVVKVHPDRTDPAALGVRLRVAADPRLRDLLVPPVEPAPRRAAGRQITVWPAGETVSPEAGEAPWEACGELLARLHAVPVADLPGPLPPGEGTGRVVRAVGRLDAAPANGSPEAVIRRAYATLPGWMRDEGPGDGPADRPADRPVSEPVLVHGDWHLGQLVRTPGAGWRLIDIDDLGVGRPDPGSGAGPGIAELLFGSGRPAPVRPGCGPEWDLARPAGLYAAGVLPPEVWDRFLGSYRVSGGCALPPEGDPWRILDTPAQALTIQIAATCVIVAKDENRPLNDNETALVDTCRRIAEARPAP